jgi:hypothetical protein
MKHFFKNPNKLSIGSFLSNYGLVNIYNSDLINDPKLKYENNIFLLFKNENIYFKENKERRPIIKEDKILSIYEWFEQSERVLDIYEVDDDYTMVIVEPAYPLNFIIDGTYSKIPQHIKDSFFNTSYDNISFLGNSIVRKNISLQIYIENYFDIKIKEQEYYPPSDNKTKFYGFIKEYDYESLNKNLKIIK